MPPIDLAEVQHSVVRIPVAGPSPNNTLVFVRGRLTGGPTTSGDSGDILRSTWFGVTAYRIDGFDQSRAADYLANTRFSVTAFLSFVYSHDDQAFTVAIDEIEGHLDNEGTFYVTGNLASAIDGDELDFNVSYCAYILVQEPQPDFTRPPRKGPRLGDRVKLSDWVRIQERGLFRMVASEEPFLVTSPADRLKVIDHDCP